MSSDYTHPHSGCTSLNPSCINDECQCEENLICNKNTASLCNYGRCECGRDSCSDFLYQPICEQYDPDCPECSTCEACSVDSDIGDGTSRGNCPNETDKCHSDGTCTVCNIAIGEGTAANPHSGCETDLPYCNFEIDQCVAADFSNV